LNNSKDLVEGIRGQAGEENQGRYIRKGDCKRGTSIYRATKQKGT
jgi:hypothetical protein